jgi:predicted enzyme related to lactoylglutathione lyase
MEISYVNVFVSDMKKSAAFYENVLGLEKRFADEGHGYASFAAGPVTLGLAVAGDEQRSLVGRHTGIGFAVDDLVAAHERLAAVGVEFTQPPERYPWGGFMALFADPDGNIYYLDEVSAAHA